MHISEVLLDIISIHAVISIAFGILVGVIINIKQTKYDMTERLTIRLFLFMELILGGAVLSGLLIHKFTDLIPKF